MSDEKLHIKPAEPDAKCDVHDRSTEGLARHVITEARRLHGHGGLNVCRNCVERAAEDAKRARAPK